MNGEHKITSGHRERTALVYLRQSTLVQVREHTESTSEPVRAGRRGRAALGWAPRDVEVIDTDLGISGKWAAAREGFTELCHRVCTGRGRGDLRHRDHPAGPVERRRGPAGGVRPDHRHAADRPRRGLRPRRRERPGGAGLQGHHGPDGAARDGPAAAGGQAGRGRARRAAHPAARRAGPRRRRR